MKGGATWRGRGIGPKAAQSCQMTSQLLGKQIEWYKILRELTPPEAGQSAGKRKTYSVSQYQQRFRRSWPSRYASACESTPRKD